MRSVVASLVGVGFLTSTAVCAAAPRSLDIYFIDVEGGQSTLIVTPGRQSLLIDTGFPGEGTLESRPGDPHRARDANRIVAAARDAGIKQIDYLLITHFHPDHDGGVPELAQLMPIRHFIDHGRPNPEAEKNVPGTMAVFEAYAAARSKGEHVEPAVGDRLPLKEIEAIVVSSGGSTLPRPFAGRGEVNGACGSAPIPPMDPYENPQSTGVMVRFGKFRFLDVGDLTGKPLHDLACPRAKVGAVDVYLVAHHGGRDAADPGTFTAFRPRVAVINNGLKKGGSLEAYAMLHHVAGLEDVWQLHRSEAAGDQNFASERIANLDESTAYWIKLTAHPDGSFRAVNGRTGEWKDYPAR